MVSVAACTPLGDPGPPVSTNAATNVTRWARVRAFARLGLIRMAAQQRVAVVKAGKALWPDGCGRDVRRAIPAAGERRGSHTRCGGRRGRDQRQSCKDPVGDAGLHVGRSWRASSGEPPPKAGASDATTVAPARPDQRQRSAQPARTPPMRREAPPHHASFRPGRRRNIRPSIRPASSRYAISGRPEERERASRPGPRRRPRSGTRKPGHSGDCA
jgi:hypothetical protein